MSGDLWCAQPIGVGGVWSDVKGTLKKGKESAAAAAEAAKALPQLTKDISTAAQGIPQLTKDISVVTKIAGVGIVGALVLGAVMVLRK